MGRFTEKQMLLATIVVSVLLVAGFGALAWMDWKAIYAAEITDEHPEAAEVSDPEHWGERRAIQEIERQMEEAQAEADLIPKREQDVIVYREIVQRDSQILPDFDDVNRLATTINDFEVQSGVALKTVLDLNVSPDAQGQAIRTMPIRLQLSGTFDQFLKFLNLFETLDRIVNTRGFTISAGRPLGEGRDRQAIHDIQLDLVTFIYTSSAGLAKPVEIANYDRRKDDPVIQKLVRQQKAAHVDKYQLKPRINRRDPLVDPRRRGAGAESETDPEAAAKQKQEVDRLRFEVELLKEDVRQEAIFLQEKRYTSLTEIKRIIDEKVQRLEADVVQTDPKVTLQELREVFDQEVRVPFEAIRGERARLPKPVFVTKRQAEDHAEKMRAHMEAREYEKVVRVLADFENATKGTDLAEDAAEAVAEMRDLAREAQVMLDFDGLHVKVSGLIIRPEGSRAIINGKALRVGAFVDPAHRCILKEIATDRLTFEFDGFEIEHSLAKQRR